MTAKQIAQLIPAEYRKEILDTNVIGSAQPVTGDPSMTYLGVIWKNYVAPDEKLDCALCLERILGNFKNLLPDIVALEKDRQLLESV
jgi:hypothetical protein